MYDLSIDKIHHDVGRRARLDPEEITTGVRHQNRKLVKKFSDRGLDREGGGDPSYPKVHPVNLWWGDDLLEGARSINSTARVVPPNHLHRGQHLDCDNRSRLGCGGFGGRRGSRRTKTKTRDAQDKGDEGDENPKKKRR